MEEEIYKIIIENAGTVLKDMVLLNPKRLSKKIAIHLLNYYILKEK